MNEKEMRSSLAHRRPWQEVLSDFGSRSVATLTVDALTKLIADAIADERERTKQLERRLSLVEARLRRLVMDADL